MAAHFPNVATCAVSHVRVEDNQVLRTAWRVTHLNLICLQIHSYLHHVSRSYYYSILLRKNQTIDDLPPFASTPIPCPSLLNVLVMPAIAERYDIMINTLYHSVACCSISFHNINTYSLIVGSLQ